MLKQLSLNFFSLLLLLCSFQSCGVVGVGRRDTGDDQVVGRIRMGHTTKAEVSNLLGEPDVLTKLSTGTEVWSYQYLRKRVVYLNYNQVPLSGNESEDREVLIEFSRRGLVSRIEKNPRGINTDIRLGG